MQALFVCTPVLPRKRRESPAKSSAPICALLPVFLANLPYQIKKFILDMG